MLCCESLIPFGWQFGRSRKAALSGAPGLADLPRSLLDGLELRGPGRKTIVDLRDRLHTVADMRSRLALRGGARAASVDKKPVEPSPATHSRCTSWIAGGAVQKILFKTQSYFIPNYILYTSYWLVYKEIFMIR